MALLEPIELTPDLELFSCHEQMADSPITAVECLSAHSCWELGFGPIDSIHAIWGLYRFQGSSRVAYERVLLWQPCPAESELFEWCARVVGELLATRLLQAVGTVDAFYKQYFENRPDLIGLLASPSS